MKKELLAIGLQAAALAISALMSKLAKRLDRDPNVPLQAVEPRDLWNGVPPPGGKQDIFTDVESDSRG